MCRAPLGCIPDKIRMGIAVAIGVLSGLLNAIPFLGTVIALVIGIGYALIAENVTPLIPGLNPNDLALYVLILVVIVHVVARHSRSVAPWAGALPNPDAAKHPAGRKGRQRHFFSSRAVVRRTRSFVDSDAISSREANRSRN